MSALNEAERLRGRAALLADLLAQLADDGDTVELDDTHSLVLHVETDGDSSIRDADCWGLTERYAHDYCREGRTQRPPEMDGSARKIEVDRGYWVWWQPADHLKSPKRWARAWSDAGTEPPVSYADALRQHVELATELLRYGFKQVGLELRETLTDSLGHEHSVTIETAWLGGIDSLGDGYLAEVLGELVDELPLPETIAG